MSMIRRPRIGPSSPLARPPWREQARLRHGDRVGRDGAAAVADRRGLEARVVELRVLVGGDLALERQRPADGEVRLAGDEEVLGREARDDLTAVLRHDELLLDPRRRPAVARWPERLEREDHALADLLGMVERDEPAEDRLLPDRQPDAVPELQGERRLLIRAAELLRLGPDRDDLGGRRAGADAGDRGV